MTFLQPFRIGITAALIWLSVFSVPAVVKAGSNISAGKAIAADYAVSINTAQTSTGSTITVNWTAPDGHSPNDFLRLHKVSDGDNVYAWSEVLGAAASGSFNVSVPNAVARYEFRLFNASTNQSAAQSTSFLANKPNFSVSSSPLTITAGGQITVDWTAPANRPVTDLLVITPANNASAISQEFTNGLNPKTIKMKAPAQPGQYEVRYVEANASQSFAPSAIGQIITVEAAAGSFAGQVKNAENGAYIAGALVEVMQSNVVKAYAVTNSNGAYSIPVTTAGTYDIKVSAAGFPNAARSGLVLQSGGTVAADFNLSNTGTLSGQITRSGGSSLPVSGAFIRVKQGSSIIANGITNSSGNYQFLRLPPGTYSAEISAGGYNSLTQNSISITAGETTALNLSLVQNQSGGSNDLEYVYDNAGRLSATKEQGILKNIYNYDLTGNLLSITSPQGTAPAIIAFTPGTGQSGTQVVIQGINFSENAGENAVSFNGTSAVISSFSSSEIVTSVPAGATTGNITVTTPDGAAVSGSPFIIGSATGNGAPFISSFSPHLGHPGDPVTITGGNFESEASDNSVLIGSIATSVTSAAISSLVVPANSSSGRISVTTPNGMALSADEFVTVPASVDLSSVVYGGKTWFGNYKSVNIPANDKRSVITFDASVGKRFSVQLFNLSSGVKINIYRPDGRLMSTNNFAPSLPPLYLFIDTQDVSISGTYTIVSTPLSSNGIPPSFMMLVHDVPPDIIEEIPVYGQKQVWFGTPGQNGVLTFNATAGQKILIKIEDNTFDGMATVRKFSTSTNNPSTPVGSGVGYVVGKLNYSADGMTIPSNGTYSIFLDPTAAATGTMSVSLRFVPPDPVFSMSIGETETFSTMHEGQNAWVQFSGTAGQRVSLLLRDETYASGFYIYFTRPDGGVWRNWVYGDGNTFVDTMVLPVSGTYKILIDPYGFDTGSFTIDLFNVPPDIVGSTTINGTPVTVNTAVPGHNPSITFDAIQGEQARVSVSNSTLPNGTSFYIVPPGGGILSATNIVNGSGLIHSASLPVTGTYRVEINPQGVSLGGATISVGGDMYGTVDPGGTPGTVTINNPGQNAWLSFSGTAGQRVSLKLTNVTLGSGTVSFRKPDGSILGSTLQIGTNNNFLDTVTLPANGTYKVLINPGDSTGSATLNMYNVPANAAGTIAVGGDAETRSTTVPGQNLSLELAGTANQRFSLEVSQVTLPGNTAIYIKKPDGSDLTSIGTSTNGAILNNIVLPETGTYTILIDPSYDYTGGIALQLFGTGTGSNPTIQFFNSVSVRKGSAQQEDEIFSFSVSVRKGMSSNYNAEREYSNSVSVRFGNIQNHSFGSSVSVTTGPVITALSPTQAARGGSSFTLTVTGTNLSGATAVKFFDGNGVLDSSVTVSDITVNSAGTALTATIQIGSSGTSGTRTVIVETGSYGSSQPGAAGANIFTINP